MNIVYARMEGYNWVSTPSDAVAREIEKLGHSITIIDSVKQRIPIKKYDFVWSPYESVTLLGDALSKKLNIPHFSHIEVIPPWRYFENCDVENYGLDKNEPEVTDLPKTKPYYTNVGKAWEKAEISTISSQCRIGMHKKEWPNSNPQLRYPSVDTAALEIAKRMYSPKRIQNKILTIARMTSIKRYDLLVKVMNQVDSEVTWAIIGEGPMAEKVKHETTNPNVKVELLGPLWGWNRFYHLLSSKLFVYAMGGMPPLEAAYLGCFPLVIEQQPTKHLPEFDKFMFYNFGDSMPIFKHTEIKKMAATIDEEIQKKDGESLKEYDTVNKFLSGETNVTPSSTNAKNIIKLMKEFTKKIKYEKRSNI